MTMTAGGWCLGDDELTRFLHGDAAEEDLSRWAEHLAGCPPCESRLKQLRTSDTLIEACKAQAAVEPPPESDVVARVMDRLMDMPGSASLSSQITVVAVPKTVPGNDGRLPDGPDAGRYEFVEELGRGGMGVVVLGHDRHMDRELALKVLPENCCDRPQQMRRLLNEARITGRLQHPGIVPVYDRGELPGRRPYFTMKLVEGRTFAALLRERTDPGQDLPRLLGVFEQVCQAVAYAHSKGVIHRDLKPANIMVGAFGEVLVMDWGLAKVFGSDAAGHGRQVVDSRSLADTEVIDDETLPGEVMGTPAYMAPEQARGEVDRLDKRCDVFGLGAILCEILTGRASLTGSNSAELLRRARAGDHAEALARLHTCGAEEDLVRLAEACLAPEPAGRPADAGAVAAAITAHLRGVQERLRRAELERAAAQVAATEERKRRKLTLLLAVAVVSLLLVGGGAALWFQRQRAELRRGTESALVTVAGLRDAARWKEALDVLGQAESRISAAPPADLQQRVAQARADLTLARQLDDIRQKRATIVDVRFDDQAADHEYIAAFRSAGLWAEDADPDAVAQRIRESAIQAQLVAALDDWANVHVDWSRRTWLLLIASRAGSDDWGARFRDPQVWGDRAALLQLVNEARMSELSPQLLTTVGLLMNSLKLDAVAWWSAAQGLHPNDFWLNYHLGIALRKTGKPADAIGYYRAALAIRPESVAVHITLGNALKDKGQVDDAIRMYRRALELDPGVALVHDNLGVALAARGRWAEAEQAHRRAIELAPEFPPPHHNLAMALDDQGRLDEALVEYRQAIALNPREVKAHNNLGMLLLKKHMPDEAAGEFRAAIDIEPGLATIHVNLGLARMTGGQLPEAVAAFRKALELDGKDARAYCCLGQALCQQRKFAEGAAALRRASALAPPGSAMQSFAAGELRKHQREILLDEARRLLPSL
jgi:tetratricopeptide (TPR) repeat protein